MRKLLITSGVFSRNRLKFQYSEYYEVFKKKIWVLSILKIHFYQSEHPEK